MDYQYDQNNQFEKPQPAAPNGLASAALVFGIISLCSSCCFYFSLPAAGLSILFALLSKGYETKMTGRAKMGAALSIAAIILSIILLAGILASGDAQNSIQQYRDFYYSDDLPFTNTF